MKRPLAKVKQSSQVLTSLLHPLSTLPIVGDIRQCGMMVGIELVKIKKLAHPFPTTARMGHKVAIECRKKGLLIRPIADVVVLIPPLNVGVHELREMIDILHISLRSYCLSYYFQKTAV